MYQICEQNVTQSQLFKQFNKFEFRVFIFQDQLTYQEPSLPFYLFMVWGRIAKCIHLPGYYHYSLLNTQQHKVHIKGKWSNPRKSVVSFPTPRCSSYWKGNLQVTLNNSRQLNKFCFWKFGFFLDSPNKFFRSLLCSLCCDHIVVYFNPYRI